MSPAAQSLAASQAPQMPPMDSVGREQLRMLFEHMALGSILATTFAGLLVAYLFDEVAWVTLATWLGLKVGIVLPRMALLVLYRRRPVAEPGRWMVISNLLVAADGLVWGLGGLWFTQGPMAQAAVVAACLCSVACVATFGLQVSSKTTSAFVVPIMVLTAMGLLTRDGGAGFLPTAGLLLVLVLMLGTARRTERRLLEVFRLRLLAQQIAEERAHAVVVLEGHSEHKSRFIATVSHEVRSPLHGIIGLAELLEREVTEPTQRRHVELIASTGRHLLTLVSDLLDMSKIEAGTLRLDPIVFDLSEELEQWAALYLARAQQAGVQLHTRFTFPRPLGVVGDSGRVRQVLDNLVGNAIKFTPRGGSVTMTVTLLAGRGIEFVVTDTGPGISTADQARLFQPYEQGSAAPERAREGAGLGLAIARDLVAFMQGSLTCDSELGRGSSFVCLLPLPLAPMPAAAPTPAAPTPASAVELATVPIQLPGHSALVLVVDDDEVSALVASAALQRAGWEVEVAGDGQRALERLTTPALRQRLRLVLMDCDLPQLDGLEATRRIRAWERRSGARPLHIVALTGRATAAEKVDCLRAGMNEVFTKPFSMAALAQAAARHAVDDPATNRLAPLQRHNIASPAGPGDSNGSAGS